MIGASHEFNQGDKTKEFLLFGKGSVCTDDSVMSIAVAEALLDAREKGAEMDGAAVKKMLDASM